MNYTVGEADVQLLLFLCFFALVYFYIEIIILFFLSLCLVIQLPNGLT